MFQKPIEVYEKATRAYLKAIQGEFSDRLTINNVSKYLLYQISGTTNDITAASCITGQGHSLAGTRIHYTVMSVDYLRDVMRKALTPLLKSIGKDVEKIEFVKTRTQVYVGARHCLTKDSYTQAVAEVIRDLQSKKRIKTNAELVSYHNLYTAYTAWMFNFGIVNRAHANPLADTSHFDVEESISTYRDKDLEVPYHSRLIWLPPEVMRQLRNYEEHLSAVRAVVSMYRELSRDPIYAESGFFLKNDMKPEEIRSVTMREHLYKRYIDAPNNSHRRFIRSELVEMGHPVESIDNLLGHWFAGEEPWSYFSTFDFIQHIDLLKQNLVHLMDEIGFRSCRSNLLVGKL